MNSKDNTNLATVLKLLSKNKGARSKKDPEHRMGHSSRIVECYQDLKVPGDFAKFLTGQDRNSGNRILKDTQGHVYFFKKTINKKNQFGKACRCGVWVCKYYRRLHCCCAVYTFGDTIVGSTGPHNHHPVTPGSEHEANRVRSRAGIKVSLEFKNKVRKHNSGPKVDSIKRSLQWAREQLNSNRKRRKFRRRIQRPPPPRTKVEEEEDKSCDEPAPCVEEVKTEIKVDPDEAAVIKDEKPSVTLVPETPAIPTPPEQNKDTFNEILEILNDMSKHSSYSYQMMCSQILSEYLNAGQGVSGESKVPAAPTEPAPAPPAPAPPVTTSDSLSLFKSAPPNVTIKSPETPSKPNHELRPVINIPALFDTATAPPSDITMTSSPSSLAMTSSPPPQAILPSKPDQLPPKTEFNILSDMTSLENLLDILKENSPIIDPGALRCTCKTLLRCNLHDIGPGKKRQVVSRPRKVLTRNDDIPKPARKKYCYRGSKKPYKFIPETFKDCQLPANEDTVIGTAHTTTTSNTTTTATKKGRGGRRARSSKPVNLPPPPSPSLGSIPIMSGVPGLTPISPAPEPRSGNTINLVPVTSVSAPSFENSKLLKAVPIGNGLYRLEEANESEMQSGGAFSKPIFTTDCTMGNGMLTPNGALPFPPGVPFLNSRTSAASSAASKPLTVIEHHPALLTDSKPESGKAKTVVSSATGDAVTNQLNSLITSVLSSMNIGKGASESGAVPLMIPAHPGGSHPVTSSASADEASAALVNQLIERLLSVDSAGAATDSDKLLEALNLSLPGIIQH